MSKDLADIILMVCAAFGSALMGWVLVELRGTRDKVANLAEAIARLEGRFEARRGGDWTGDERRKKADS